MRSPSHPGDDVVDLSAVLEALSEPTRRQIVARLANQPEAACSSFVDCASKSNLTYHFNRLREAGVISVRKEAQFRLISLRREALQARFPGLLDAILAADRIDGERFD
ncbi:helix-turn-helix domain-containing protein [Rhizobium lusitanum]|uniref:Helix-turn-helix domain-containing protein n=1 Tax=Rhizobium lusitanum TaxID=293958 RepID=A0A6L9UGD8_9HYPH|nr:helix-turn-helix transcriptional regulator [Rhizobium lusitanum]NEI74391.1 helix-turn-helix domain-containing protein [Rhizobium lusitanum]